MGLEPLARLGSMTVVGAMSTEPYDVAFVEFRRRPSSERAGNSARTVIGRCE